MRYALRLSVALTLLIVAATTSAANRGTVADAKLPLVSVVDAPMGAAAMRARHVPGTVSPPLGDPLTAPLAFSPSESDLFSDAADGKLDEHSLLQAGLVAGGTDTQRLGDYQTKFNAAVEELRDELASADETEPLQLVHRVLYRRLLRMYDAQATDLAQALDTGVYNCASATLLFVALGQAIDLEITAVELPGHVRAVAQSGGASLEIEVTCRDWADAISTERGLPLEQRSSPSPRVAGQTSDAAGASRRPVSDTGLVAMIYYNRGIDAFSERRFADAVAENRRALLLDPANPVARGNLLAAVNNWALALSAQERFDEAEALLKAGLRYAPDHSPFAHNAAHVRQLRAKNQF